MKFKSYQEKSRETAIYPEEDGFAYLSLGLSGETGEVADKFKKIIRDKQKKITDKDREEVEKELGDVLWYIAQICNELNISMEGVAKKNLKKLSSRKKRKKLKGEGDNR